MGLGVGSGVILNCVQEKNLWQLASWSAQEVSEGCETRPLSSFVPELLGLPRGMVVMFWEQVFQKTECRNYQFCQVWVQKLAMGQGITA